MGGTRRRRMPHLARPAGFRFFDSSRVALEQNLGFCKWLDRWSILFEEFRPGTDCACPFGFGRAAKDFQTFGFKELCLRVSWKVKRAAAVAAARAVLHGGLSGSRTAVGVSPFDREAGGAQEFVHLRTLTAWTAGVVDLSLRHEQKFKGVATAFARKLVYRHVGNPPCEVSLFVKKYAY